MNEEFLGQWWIVRLSELEPRWSMPIYQSSHLRRSTASTTEAYGDGRDRKHLFSLPSTRLLSAVKACGRRIRRASKASRGKLSAGKKFSVLVDFINYPQMSMKLFCAWIFILEKFQQKKLHKLIINFLCVLAQTKRSCSWVCYLTRNSPATLVHQTLQSRKVQRRLSFPSNSSFNCRFRANTRLVESNLHSEMDDSTERLCNTLENVIGLNM